MTKEVFERDLKTIDEICLKSSRALEEQEVVADLKSVYSLTMWQMKMIYWLAVAVWHLLHEAIRSKDGAEAKRPNGSEIRSVDRP